MCRHIFDTIMKRRVRPTNANLIMSGGSPFWGGAFPSSHNLGGGSHSISDGSQVRGVGSQIRLILTAASLNIILMHRQFHILYQMSVSSLLGLNILLVKSPIRNQPENT